MKTIKNFCKEAVKEFAADWKIIAGSYVFMAAICIVSTLIRNM